MPIERPMQAFVSCGNLAIAPFGLPEYEISDADPAVLKITLLRAVNYLGAGGYANTITGGAGPHIETPDQQCMGRQFLLRYAIIPRAENALPAETMRLAQQHHAMWRGMSTSRHEGSLPAAQLSFAEVSGEGIILSSIKQADDSEQEFVLRFYNAMPRDSVASVAWFKQPAHVWHSNLSEDKIEEIAVTGNAPLKLDVGKKRIVTLRFSMPT
jgi:alpha-mannosidase